MPAPADNTVAWFEIGAPDLDAARAFHGPLFGWSLPPAGPTRSSPPRASQARPVQLEDGMAVDYITDPNGSMFALFGPKPES